jgi:hypothetical protein
VVALNVIVQGDVGGADGLILPGLAEYLLGPSGGTADGPTVNEIRTMTYDGRGKVTVNLNADSNDGTTDYPAGHPLLSESDFGVTVGFFYDTFMGSLSAKLTDQQEALLGCGRFYRTSCDLDGIDLLNMEASVAYQSWPDVEGTFDPDTSRHWDTTDRGRRSPHGRVRNGRCTPSRDQDLACPAAADPGLARPEDRRDRDGDPPPRASSSRTAGGPLEPADGSVGFSLPAEAGARRPTSSTQLSPSEPAPAPSGSPSGATA